MPLQATSGAASYDGFGGGVAAVPQYIEDVFSTYLYTGNGSSQTITNGIDLAGKGGMTWVKSRSNAYYPNIEDTVRGAGNALTTAATDPNGSLPQSITSFNANGFSLGTTTSFNGSGATFASWTFRKQPKFFDVVTYTGDGASGRGISHSLGSVPGCIIVKATSTTSNWFTWHIASGITAAKTGFQLNATNAASITTNSTGLMTSTSFDVGEILDSSTNWPNTNGVTYVAYLFAHNAGGFGLTGTDNVISCGSFTTDASGVASVTLGYEPQWVLLKKTSTGAESWYLFDNMRGIPTGSADAQLNPNLSAAETSSFDYINLSATGFNVLNQSSSATYIYIAIRRGPMKVPTSGTSVYGTATWTGAAGTQPISSPSTNFATGYAAFIKARDYGQDWGVLDQLRGVRPFVSTDSTMAEINDGTSTGGITVWPQTIWLNGGSYFGGGGDGTGKSYISYLMRRAPSFFDEVCYTGTGSATTFSHNLGVAPELMIVKCRSGALDWTTYQAPLGASQVMRLNSTIAAFTDASVWNGTAPTSSVFSVGTSIRSNSGGDTFVVYLFATCAGVSKVGSYTGNGTTQTIDCGFTGGARFVLIKRTDSTGDWYVWDTARGIISANDPHLSLNTTAAEVTTDDTIDPDSTGFIVNQVTATNVNVSSATYIYLAIA